jgi:hypothetical protein
MTRSRPGSEQQFQGLDRGMQRKRHLSSMTAHPRLRAPGTPGLRHPRVWHSAGFANLIETSPSAVRLLEHGGGFGVGHELADFLRTAAGGGDLGGPPERLLA